MDVDPVRAYAWFWVAVRRGHPLADLAGRSWRISMEEKAFATAEELGMELLRGHRHQEARLLSTARNDRRNAATRSPGLQPKPQWMARIRTTAPHGRLWLRPFPDMHAFPATEGLGRQTDVDGEGIRRFAPFNDGSGQQVRDLSAPPMGARPPVRCPPDGRGLSGHTRMHGLLHRG